METVSEYIMKDDFESLCEGMLMDKKRATLKLHFLHRYNYLSAYRDGEAYVLKKISVVCPNCGMRLHLYADKASAASARKLIEDQTDRAVAGYLDDQLSFFENPNHDYVKLNTPLPYGTKVECRRCGAHGILCERSAARKVRIWREQGKLCVSCDLDDIFEALSLGWVTVFEEDVAVGCPPYEEKLIFDFDSGMTKIQLIDGSGIACEKEVASETELFGHDRIAMVFNNFVLRRRIRKAFLDTYGDTVYFTADELNLDRYILHTRFIGYYRAFYDGIQFITEPRSVTQGRHRLPAGMRDIAQKLHRASDVPTLYEAPGLPKAKSVRKIVFEDPQLMFYVNELKLLYEVFPDVNLYRRILSCASIHYILILSALVRCGKAKDYLVMIREVLGMRWLFEYMKNRDCSDVFNKGLIYYSMPDDDKALERIRLQDSSDPSEDIGELYHGFSCSVPMKHMAMIRFDWTYDGYHFRTLRTSDDYERAGRDLHNCLNSRYGAIHEFDEYDNETGVSYAVRNENTIVGVIKNLKYVAAIDVNYDGTIGFSAIEQNKPVTCNTRLFDAYIAWLKRFGLLDLQYHQ